MLTFLAGHVGSPLVFSAGEADNQNLGFECGLRPRLDSAPSLVQARDRALLLGVPGGNWTPNGPITNRALYRLSNGHRDFSELTFSPQLLYSSNSENSGRYFSTGHPHCSAAGEALV